MSQNDFVIANQTAPNFRADLNLALQALASTSSGATAPSTTYANMLWYDTSNNILKMRSEADDAWIDLGTLDQSTNTFTPAGVAELTQVQVEDDTSTVFGQVSGQRLAQAVAANGAEELLTTTTISGSPSVLEFTFDETAYKDVVLVLRNVRVTADSTEVSIRTSSDSGSSYDSGSADYSYICQLIRVLSTVSTDGENVDNRIRLNYVGTQGNTTEEDMCGQVLVYGVGNSSAQTRLTWNLVNRNTADAQQFIDGSGSRGGAGAATNGIQILLSTGTFVSGEISLYGRR